MRDRETLLIAAGIIIVAMFLNGCAVGMAACGKRQMDTNVLMTGTSRDRVLAEFGPLESSVTNEKGELVDTWIITKGNEPSALRAIIHGAFDIATFGLWEIIGTPVEMIAAKEEKYKYIVTYNKDRTVKHMQALPIEEKQIVSEPSKKERHGTTVVPK